MIEVRRNNFFFDILDLFLMEGIRKMKVRGQIIVPLYFHPIWNVSERKELDFENST